jgi:hypothetical protein
MAATAAQIARLRRMTAEPDDTTYTDDDLATIIESYPTTDERGEDSYTWNTATTPPTQDANTSWIATYDLHAAAAEVWEEKGAAVAQDFDFSADGGDYSRSQVQEQYMAQARYHRSRRALGTVKVVVSPPVITSAVWIGNRAEVD